MISLTCGSPRLARAGCWIAMLSLLTLPTRALAGENELGLGLSGLQYSSFVRQSRIYLSVELSYHRHAAATGPWSALRLGGGLRVGPPTSDTPVPVEGFLQAQLTARFGPWEPAVGPEIGVSGFAKLFQNTFLPPGELYAQEAARLGPAYVAMTLAPLRFVFGAFQVSALQILLGTNAFPFGNTTRMQVIVLQAGMTL